MISNSLETVDTCILLSMNLAGRLEISTVYELKYKKNKKKTPPVYKNMAPIEHLLMFYKGLPMFIKNYINLSAPFLRKGILPLYIITRMYWTGILLSTNSFIKNSSIASITPSDQGCKLLDQQNLLDK